jgi:hypothetical protein
VDGAFDVAAQSLLYARCHAIILPEYMYADMPFPSALQEERFGLANLKLCETPETKIHCFFLCADLQRP